jgi:site-specific DNA-methyltransferase (adenine-specific)
MIPYYTASDIRLYNMDCLEYTKTVSSDEIDMVLTSPPYDNIRDYHGNNFNFENFKLIAAELARLIRPGGVIVWNVADATVNGSETGTSMRQALYFMDLGLRLHDTMIYAKNNPIPSSNTNKRYHQAWEYIFVLSKGTPETFNPIQVKAKYSHVQNRGRFRGTKNDSEYVPIKRNEYTKVRNVFEYSIGGGITTTDKVAFGHPALMPEKLAEDMIRTWTNAGNTVFDPFSGAGTTAKMCLQSHRKFIGTEISPTYCEIFKTRLESVSPTLLE